MYLKVRVEQKMAQCQLPLPMFWGNEIWLLKKHLGLKILNVDRQED